jgi:hypothetical protein
MGSTDHFEALSAKEFQPSQSEYTGMRRAI